MKARILCTSLFILVTLIGSADSFESLQKALENPEKVTRLSLGQYRDGDPVMADRKLKHLPKTIASLVHLKELDMACLEELEDFPEEIGSLKELESIVIDNGNGAQMNISLPESIGNLTKLKVLRLYGAINQFKADENASPNLKTFKKLPKALARLTQLEELDLGRNQIPAVPPEVASLTNLRKLNLSFNDIHELPEFIGNLPKLRELNLSSNGSIRLPDSLTNLKGLKVSIGNAVLKLADQELLQKRFPDIVFDFSNEFDDDSANEEKK